MEWSVTWALWALTAVCVTTTASSTDQPASPGATGMTFDPMTSARRQKVFSAMGKESTDSHHPDYTAMAVTSQGHLVLLDWENNKVKVMVTSSGEPRVTSSVRLRREPWDIALLPNGAVAVTTKRGDYIYLLHLEDDVITLRSGFRPTRNYSGVAAGLRAGTLVVTSRYALDVISARDGAVLESFGVSAFRRPDYLCRHGNDVIVSDWGSTVLYRIDVTTGQVLATYSNVTMETPHQVATDAAGNIYVASRGSYRVLVRSPAGQWRSLITSRKEKLPTAIGVTDTGFVVTWSDISYSDFTSWSVVKGYSLT